MVTVTNRAKQELKRVGERLDLEMGKFLRLATPPMWVGEGDFGIVIAEELDFKEAPEGARFTLDVF